MKVLVLAPHPFYQERGTPIAVDMLVRVLSDRGDEVDLLTFHEGRDRDYANVRIIRTPRLPGIANIRPGISFKKIVCDVFFFFRMLSLVARTRYDVIHAVEESSFMAMVLRPFIRTPYIADMDSLISAQIIDRYPAFRHTGSVLRWLESRPIRHAALVVPMCDRLAEDVQAYRRPEDVIVLRDVTLVQHNGTAVASDTIRDELRIDGFVLMYIGNLESYQGIDLLLTAFKRALTEVQDLHLVIIGGRSDDIAKYQTMAEELQIRAATHFLGPRSVEDIGAYMAQADVLVSPRTQGVNTPMKIYSYLDSGAPVLATDLLTHTQVLNDDIALLVEPNEQSFADGIVQLKNNPELRSRLAANASNYVAREHSYEKFRETVEFIYRKMDQRMAGESQA